ncbi:hypothetical protein NMY22_g15321 [Coprinellus aureogranulatus]|nr:hypothetical protein NMY22_g15321 [Coprinellus aureogranulatus]
MRWYDNFMKFRQKRAEEWARLDLGDGHKAYAWREADTWRRYGLEGKSLFCGPSEVEGDGLEEKNKGDADREYIPDELIE